MMDDVARDDAQDAERELLADFTEWRSRRDIYLDCVACHSVGVLVQVAELANGGELWRCGECGDEELID
ncbi:hypothetical protein AB0B25_31865 [Nocardia sp. NPDC049190]|uniref:hypothetical protein n=1 Tax=Nocardia sp. NPDC049190 TaxID=3155650 RepID=UPI0033D23BFA